jgi:hypothetical protein
MQPGEGGGEGTAASAATQSKEAPMPESVGELTLPKPRWKLWGLVVLATLGAIGGGVHWLVTRPDPFRVLVAIELDGQPWEGSRPAATLSDRVGEGLTKIGFDPVNTGDSKVDALLGKERDLVAAAKKLEAGFLISGTVTPEVLEPPLEGGLVELRVKTTLHVRFVGDATGTDVPVEVWSYGRTREIAMTQLAESLSDRVFDAAVPVLLENEVIASKLKRDIAAQAKLALAEKYAAARARNIKSAKDAYAKLDQDRAAVGGGITYLGSLSGDVRLGGVSREGPVYRTADIAPFVKPGELTLSWVYRLETLELSKPDRSVRSFWQGYHILETPGVAPEGFPIVFSEDLLGIAKTLTVVSEDGQARRVLIHPEARFLNPRVSPGGRYAALHERSCRTCARALAVVDLQDGKVVFRRSTGDDGPDARLGGYGWVSPTELAYTADPREAIAPIDDEEEPTTPPSASPAKDEPVKSADGELRVVDVGKSPALERRLFTVGHSCSELGTSVAAQRIAVTCHDPAAGASIWIVDAKTGDATDTKVAGETPELSPDGARVAYERGGDLHVFIVTTGASSPLTETPFVERAPRFSPDGARLYFESSDVDPNLPSRRVGAIAYVEVP